jgi:hypothetical protein
MPAAEAASTEGKQQNKKKPRPEKHNYTSHEQPPRGTNSKHNKPTKAADPDFSVAYGQRPRLWPCPDGSGGLLALEQRWQSCVLLRVRSRSARRREPEPAAAALPAATVTGRVHPLERAAAAAALRGQPCIIAD